MPVIAYQSLNSNASTEHDVSASNSQHFTRMTHNHLATASDRWMLSLPTAPEVSPHIPVQGPAELLASAPHGFMAKGQHGNAAFLGMVEDKARQTLQNLIRAVGGCDLLVYGEMDATHSGWSSMADHAGELVGSSSPAKACNCFSVHAAQSGVQHPVGSGDGWIAMKCYNLLAVFVHVPNSIAQSETKATQFYKNIQNTLLQAGAGVVDLFMGDTNQPSAGFTPRVVSAALNMPFADVHSSASIEPYDAYQKSFGGTNAKGTKKYDVGVYNTGTVTVKDVVYLSQCVQSNSTDKRQAAAITDHMGVAVSLTK